MVMSDTATPSLRPDATERRSENEDATGEVVKTVSLRLYGPPSGVRVVSALARFSVMISARERWASMPDALTDIAVKRLTACGLPRWRTGRFSIRPEPSGWQD